MDDIKILLLIRATALVFNQFFALIKNYTGLKPTLLLCCLCFGLAGQFLYVLHNKEPKENSSGSYQLMGFSLNLGNINRYFGLSLKLLNAN